MKNRILMTMAALLFSVQAYAGNITISEPWSRATAPGQENGSVGLVITSKKDARIIAVSSTVAKSAELHTMTMDNGVMKMRQLDDMPLPANQPVTLGPGGDHLMLFGIKHPLKAGSKVPLTLTIEYADKSKETVHLKALVRPLAASNEMQHGNNNH